VRVGEADHQQERAPRVGITGDAARVAVPEPRDDAVGEERIPHESGVGSIAAVRFGADPSGEPEGGKGVGVDVGLHRGVIDMAVVVVGRQA
jgi:hypothetical protein